jgi:uncharacterized protein
MPERENERPDWFALAAAAVTVALHFLLQARGPNLAFIVGSGLFWALFVAAHAWRDRGVFRGWGFRVDNLGPASLPAVLLFVVTAAGMAAYAAVQGFLRLPADLWPILLLYPAWGLVQQFLSLAIVLANLERTASLGRRKALLVLLGATLFALVHVPDPWLVAAAFALELAVIALYLRWRNLWTLGVLHGWLGGFFYLWVLNRDLWQELTNVARAR